MVDYRIKILSKVAIILLMIGLIVYLVLGANSLSCNECSVTLKKFNGLPMKYNMSDLFNQTKLIKCPIYWDRVNGYVKS